MSESEFASSYGEVARLIRHVGCPESEAITRIHSLHQRHARQVAGVLERAIGAFSKQILGDHLPRTCLLRLAIDKGLAAPASPCPAVEMPPGRAPPRYGFWHSGDVWQVHFEGASFHVLDGVGARYLACILRHAGRPITVSELNRAVSPKAHYVPETRSEPVTTAANVQLLIDEIKETAELLAAAEKRGDLTQVEVHRRRRDELGKSLQLSAFRGKPKRESSSHKRTRDRVLKALRDVLGRVKRYCTPAWTHLDTFLSRGTTILYTLPTGVEWAFFDATQKVAECDPGSRPGDAGAEARQRPPL